MTISGTSSADAPFLPTDATAAEGFRVSPGTLIVLQANPTVIVEKATPPFKLRYQYIIEETVLVCSGEKEVVKVQDQGYTLIGETERGTADLPQFEKASHE